MNRVETSRHILSIVLFVVGVLFFLLLWLGGGNLLLGLVIGAAVELVGLIFFRRGK